MKQLSGIVLQQLGRLPTLEAILMHDPGPNEVEVRMVAAGICHTDLSYVQYARACPVLLGHEGAGVVEQAGANVTHVKPGDHVVVNWLPKCGRCRWCLRSRPDLCERTLGTDEPRVFWRGQALNVMLSAGAFAPFVVLPGNGAVPIRKDMPMEKAALLGCAVATGVGAVQRTACVQPGEDVVVIGVGGVGLCTIQAARLALAGQVIAVDVKDTALALAAELGATRIINAGREDPVKCVRELTNGRGVEHVFEVVGLPASMGQGIQMLSRGGALTLIGAAERDAQLDFPPRRFMSQQQTIRGCIYGNIRPFVDLPLLADWYMDGRLKLDPLHTSTVKLSDVPEIFAQRQTVGGIRTLIDFSGLA